MANPSNPPAPYLTSPLRPPPPDERRSRGIDLAVGIALAVVVVGLVAVVVVPRLLSDDASDSFGEVPKALDGDMSPSPVFASIKGYGYAAVAQSHLDAARRAVESRIDAANIQSVNGRVVRKDKTAVAEAIAITFNPDAAVDAAGGIDAVAAEMSSSERITISGASGVYGRAPDGSQIIVVYKGNVGLVVAGLNRSTMQDVTAKLLANV